MKLIDKIHQKLMITELRHGYGADVTIQKGPNGSLYIPSELQSVPKWTIDGPSDFDKFIKRYGMSAVDKDGKAIAYTMASRGTKETSKNVTMIIPEYRDKLGRKWTILQEEARPIDIARRSSNARILAFPAGIIGDEVAFASETATESAIRELSEETGLVAKKIINLTPTVGEKGLKTHVPIMTSPGLTDESTHYFKALIKELRTSKKALTDGITQGWHFVPVKKLPKWFTKMEMLSKIPSGQTLTAIALSLLTKGKIR